MCFCLTRDLLLYRYVHLRSQVLIPQWVKVNIFNMLHCQQHEITQCELSKMFEIIFRERELYDPCTCNTCKNQIESQSRVVKDLIDLIDGDDQPCFKPSQHTVENFSWVFSFNTNNTKKENAEDLSQKNQATCNQKEALEDICAKFDSINIEADEDDDDNDNDSVGM